MIERMPMWLIDLLDRIWQLFLICCGIAIFFFLSRSCDGHPASKQNQTSRPRPRLTTEQQELLDRINDPANERVRDRLREEILTELEYEEDSINDGPLTKGDRM